MTPKTRDELVEVMATAIGEHEGSPGWTQYVTPAEFYLTALEAAGCAVVPVEATEEMRRHFRYCLGFSPNEPAGLAEDRFEMAMRNALAASPFKASQ
ncbi:hypothetical protein CU669_15025 [Paramagnetospirillum kuznetsovii]|uniref:Uncharacterized protein n=1 Tax=Paramagnetospirillum kuznetsovii TaxID=2053833 RepID=A0A364NVX4_9PROT|nr:hypothetical protein [Paramagnetospirillum kuznetsovii]RAU21067.1 hypothetical protein CU669_15025 [Paramagnetospirillum kuznetsovii]